ncbi:MAG: hypothetical protein K2J42_09790, partial [Muribaculaceae bacterium]|nr:hypothetical protein [Muribaculaceae bacterium]
PETCYYYELNYFYLDSDRKKPIFSYPKTSNMKKPITFITSILTLLASCQTGEISLTSFDDESLH